MRLQCGPGPVHLTYCTNIHPGEGMADLERVLSEHVPEIRGKVSPEAPFGVGLRIAAKAAETLRDPAERERLRALLDDAGAYLFTINGFPYGGFHGQRVKENVYAPDWASAERLTYTNDLADTLAALMPEGLETGSISTVPGTFKPWADPGRIRQMSERLIAHAAHLVDIERHTDRRIALALEPEPCCYLETIDETVAYFEEHLFSGRGIAWMQTLTGLSPAGAEAALRRHLGVCYDVCHAAVEYEDVAGGFDRLAAAGIAVPKLQLSSALRIPAMNGAAAEALAPYAEPVYLHQVIEKGPHGLKRYADLPEALDNLGEAEGLEWRVHFHVPVFLPELTAFSTTQDFLREVIALLRTREITPHLEIETYTWDVLPPEFDLGSVNDAIAREIGWVKDELLA